MESTTMNVTSIEELIKQSQGSIVELPPFCEGMKFYARLKRPSMLSLVRRKKIPNTLLSSANSLFAGGPAALDTRNEAMMEEIFNIMDILCEEAFVQPTYKEIKDAGIQLTDDQLMFIFGYTQTGVKQLDSFR